MALKRKKLSEEEARERMADLCARAEQCVFDIDQKLFRLGVFSDQRERIVTYLKENRFIDDGRFALNYAREKCRYSSWGPYKVKHGLALKRISNEDISNAIAEVEDEEWDKAALRAATTKSKGLDLNGEDAKNERLKLFRFMFGRGFGSEKASEMVKLMAKMQRGED